MHNSIITIIILIIISLGANAQEVSLYDRAKVMTESEIHLTNNDRPIARGHRVEGVFKILRIKNERDCYVIYASDGGVYRIESAKAPKESKGRRVKRGKYYRMSVTCVQEFSELGMGTLGYESFRKGHVSCYEQKHWITAIFESENLKGLYLYDSIVNPITFRKLPSGCYPVYL